MHRAGRADGHRKGGCRCVVGHLPEEGSGADQRMVFGANTYRAFARMLASSTEDSEVRDPWVTRMRSLPATVVSTTLEAPLDWPDASVVGGDAVDVVARLKEESEVP